MKKDSKTEGVVGAIPARILVIDDNEVDRMIYRRLLNKAQIPEFVFLEADSGAAGLRMYSSLRPDCVLVDYHLPDADGLSLIQAMTDSEHRAPIIMLTGNASTPLAIDALKVGAVDFLQKSDVSSRSMERAVSNALEKQALRVARERAQVELHQTVERVKRQNDEIRSFYHTLSHELKTPLTAIQEFISLVTDGLAGPINDQQMEYLDVASQNCVHLARHINDILDVTRLDTGKLSIDCQQASLTGVVEEIVETLGAIARKRGINLSIKAPNKPIFAVLDVQRILQVLDNLIGNALKFTHSGGNVTVRIETLEGHASVSVEDNGPGIADDLVCRIFDRLYQATDQEDRVLEKGLGLGLSICRDLVELHGGAISVTSTVGVGSCFTFSVPVVEATEVRELVSDTEDTHC